MNNTSRKQEQEYHVASFVIHAMQDQVEQVRQDILQCEGTEIHATSADGKIVFTVEATSQFAIGDIIDQLKLHTGIFSLSPVYHQFLPQE